MVKIDTEYYDTENQGGKKVSEKHQINPNGEPYRTRLFGTDIKALLRYMPILVMGAVLFILGLIDFILLIVGIIYAYWIIFLAILNIVCGIILFNLGIRRRNKVLGIPQRFDRFERSGNNKSKGTAKPTEWDGLPPDTPC